MAKVTYPPPPHQSTLEKKFCDRLGEDGNRFDIVQSKRWDSISVHDAFTRANTKLFVLPLSADKTLADTNMEMSSQLPMPTSFLVERIIFSFSRASTDEDVYSIAEAATFQFYIGYKHYARALLIHAHQYNVSVAPFRVCDFCKSVYVGERCPSCGAQQFSLSSIGEEIISGRQFCMETPTHPIIVSGQCFHVDFDCHPVHLRAPVKLWCHLEGLEARAVQ